MPWLVVCVCVEDVDTFENTHKYIFIHVCTRSYAGTGKQTCLYYKILDISTFLIVRLSEANTVAPFYILYV